MLHVFSEYREADQKFQPHPQIFPIRRGKWTETSRWRTSCYNVYLPIKDFIHFMTILPECIHVYLGHAAVLGSQKVLSPQEYELWMVASHRVGAGNQATLVTSQRKTQDLRVEGNHCTNTSGSPWKERFSILSSWVIRLLGSYVWPECVLGMDHKWKRCVNGL